MKREIASTLLFVSLVAGLATVITVAAGSMATVEVVDPEVTSLLGFDRLALCSSLAGTRRR